MRINNQNLIPNSPIDLSNAWESEAVWIGHIYSYSVQLVFTETVATLAGNFKLQASNDEGRNTSNFDSSQSAKVLNWTDVLDSAQTISGSGNHTWDVSSAGYAWVRVVWTPTGGQGVLNSARINIKGV